MIDFTLDDIAAIVDADPVPTKDEFLDARYETHNTLFGHHWPYYRSFYRLAQMLQPRLIVELGGWQGTAASHFAGGCPDATIITIDHLSDPGDEINEVLMNAATARYENLMFLKGWTWGDGPGEPYSTISNYGSYIDILFIDSWHDYEHAMKDWKLYRPLLASPSLVICDDIIGGYGPVISGMLDFWNELPDPKFLNSRIHPNSNVGFLKYGED